VACVCLFVRVACVSQCMCVAVCVVSLPFSGGVCFALLCLLIGRSTQAKDWSQTAVFFVTMKLNLLCLLVGVGVQLVYGLTWFHVQQLCTLFKA
jgi:hypothetical protein